MTNRPDQPQWRRYPQPSPGEPEPTPPVDEPTVAPIDPAPDVSASAYVDDELVEDEAADYEDDEEYEEDEPPGMPFAFPFFRVSPGERTSTDPTFPFLISMALSIGLAAATPQNADIRYVVAWGAMAGFAVFAWLLGDTTRIEKASVEDLVWGAVFGFIVGFPLLFIGSGTLEATARLMFRTGYQEALIQMPTGTVLAFLVFVMPLAETLFFRGMLQKGRAFWLVGLLSSVWSITLFLPMIEVARFPLIAVIISTALITINLIYAYVRQRNGLAAAWICQIVMNLLLIFVPYLTA